jgi:hypothetical protein
MVQNTVLSKYPNMCPIQQAFPDQLPPNGDYHTLSVPRFTTISFQSECSAVGKLFSTPTVISDTKLWITPANNPLPSYMVSYPLYWTRILGAHIHHAVNDHILQYQRINQHLKRSLLFCINGFVRSGTLLIPPRTVLQRYQCKTP